MESGKLFKAVKAFGSDQSGESLLRTSLILGGFAMLAAAIAAPVLDKAAQTIAENRQYGVDRIITSAIDNPKRYTIRKSVLDGQNGENCGQDDSKTC